MQKNRNLFKEQAYNTTAFILLPSRMKKILLLLIFVMSTSIAAFSADTENYIDANGKKQGHWTIYGRMQANKAYDVNAKVEEGNYTDNSKTGLWTGYFPNGKKKSEFTYVNNRPNGPAITYNDQGIKIEEGTWVGNHWVGEYKLYYDDGTPRQKFNYNTTGQTDGVQTNYNPNGTVAIVCTKKAGKEDGWKKEYDENGNLIRETYFNGGVIDPSKTIVHQVKATPPATSQEDPVNDKKRETPPPAPPQPNWNGEGQNTLMKNGQVSQKGTFHLYKLVNGEVRFYDNNGMLTQIKLYKDGKYIADAPIPADANQ